MAEQAAEQHTADEPRNQPDARQQFQPGDLGAGPPKDQPAPEPFEARCARLGLPAAEDVAAAGPDELPALLADLSAEQLDALHVREVNAHDRMIAESKDRLRAIRQFRDKKALLRAAAANRAQLEALLDAITGGNWELKAKLREELDRVTAGPKSAPEPPTQAVNAPGAPGKGK